MHDASTIVSKREAHSIAAKGSCRLLERAAPWACSLNSYRCLRAQGCSIMHDELKADMRAWAQWAQWLLGTVVATGVYSSSKRSVERR